MIPWHWRERLEIILSAVGKGSAEVDLEALVDDLQQAEVGLAMRRTMRSFPSTGQRLAELEKVSKACKILIGALRSDEREDRPPIHILGALAEQLRPGAPSLDDVRSTLATLMEAATRLDRWTVDAARHLERPPPHDPQLEAPPEKPETWLIGERLPVIYSRHFGKWPVSKSNGVPGGAGIAFVQVCAGMMGVEATPDMIDVYRRRSAKGHPPRK